LVQLYAWDQLSGIESAVQVEVVAGQLAYEKSASVLVKMKSLTTEAKSIEDFVKVDIFPNPSVGRVNVRFSQLAQPGSTIEILDLSGRKVASRSISGTTEVFNLSGVSKGIYLVKAVIGSSETVQKLIIE